jgi:membrane fusion protein (multidrug efflux system)
MAKRMILMLTVMAVFVGTVGTVKFRQIQMGMAQAASFQPPPEAVTTIVARQEAWPHALSTIGTAVAVHGVTVSADLPGMVSRIAFESGTTVEKGAVLAALDTRQEQAQLTAALAQLELTRLNLERAQGLRNQGIIAQAEADRVEAEHKQADARVGEIRATIDRKTIRAPFSGILGIRQINLGQYLQAGEAVVPLQSLHPIYVNFTVPQQEVEHLKVGGGIEVSVEGMSGDGLPGRITAIDSVVDSTTRNVQIQATLPNGNGRLRPGMFVRAQLDLGQTMKVVALPASAISYAPYGDSIFVVGEMKGPKGESYRGVRQQFVKLGGSRGDQVAVLEGVEPGAAVVTSGAFKLRNGAAVHVNNAVQPGNNPAPKPEDN